MITGPGNPYRDTADDDDRDVDLEREDNRADAEAHQDWKRYGW